MKYLLHLSIISLLLQACSKNSTEPPGTPADTASYRVAVRLAWTNPQFALPAANAHFTAFVGMVHRADTFLWKPGGLATVGLEFLAEVGSNGRLNNEIDTMIANGKALSRFVVPAPPVTGGFDTVFALSRQHPAVSFASMIAPSPDWFVGLNNYSLLRNSQWVDDITVPLYLFDAGTEDGDVFGYDNPASNPQQFVRPLSAAMASVLSNGNGSLPPIGSIRFIRL